MFKRLLQFGFMALLPVIAGAQTLTYPALSTDNTFTGDNTFQGDVTVSGSFTCTPSSACTDVLSAIGAEPALGDPGTNGYVLSSTTSGTRSWVVNGGSMVYPGAGVGNSTGSAWDTSYTVGTAANNLVQLNSSGQLPALDGHLLTSFTLSQITTALGFTPAHSGANTDITSLSGLTTVLSPGQGGTGVPNIGPSLDNEGLTLNSTGGQSTAFGYTPFGDSYSACYGSTSVANCYPQLIASDTGASLASTSHAQGSTDECDGAYYMGYYVGSVPDAGNPLYTWLYGANDADCSQTAGGGGTDAACQVSGGVSTNPPSGSNIPMGFMQCALFAHTRALISNKNVVLATQNTAQVTFLSPNSIEGNAGNCVNGDTITVNGTVVTCVTSGATGNQFNIGASAAASATAFYTMLAASSDSNLVKSTYANPSAGIVVMTPASTGFQQTVTTSDWANISPLPQLMVQSAGWNSDATLPANNAMQCPSGTCTLTDNAFWTPMGSFYVWYLCGSPYGGTFTVKIDGSLLTDSVENNSTVTTSIYGWAPRVTGHSGTVSVCAASYSGVSPGAPHTLLITSTSGNNIIIGAAAPPASKSRGTSGPNMYTLDVTPQENGSTACLSTTASYCNYTFSVLTNQLVLGLEAQGLNDNFVHWVNTQSNYAKDFTGITPSQNCPANTYGNINNNHPSDCWQRHIANAIEDAAKITVPASPSPLKVAAIAPVNLSYESTFNSSEVLSTTALNPGFNINQCNTSRCFGFTIYDSANAYQSNYSGNYASLWYGPTGSPIGFLGSYSPSTMAAAGQSAFTPNLEFDGNSRPITFLPQGNATSSLNYASTYEVFRASGWTGSAFGNEDWQQGAYADATTHTANGYLYIRNTAQALSDSTPFVWFQNINLHGVKLQVGANSTYDLTIAVPSLSAAATLTLPTTALDLSAIAHSHIAATAVTPGSYTNASITVAADGSITAASSGSVTNPCAFGNGSAGFWPVLIYTPSYDPAGAVIISTPEQVKAVHFALPCTATVSKAQVSITTGVTSGVVDVGIMAWTSGACAATLLNTAGITATGATTSPATSTSFTQGSTILQAGDYCFAFTDNSATIQTEQFTIQAPVIYSLNADSVNGVVVCANTATSGVLPSSCGANTPSTSAVAVPMAIFK